MTVVVGGGYPMTCMCPCHYPGNTAVVNHQGVACWCYQSQGPVVVEPPKFCPHCGKKL